MMTRNQTTISQGTFATTAEEEREVLNRLTNALDKGKTMGVSPDGVIDLQSRPTVSNGITVDKGKFYVDDVKGGPLSLTADSFSMLDPEQWYAKDPVMFASECEAMRKYFPGARYGFLDDGRMIWDVTVKVAEPFTPWRFTILYEKDHPNPNSRMAGSVLVIPTAPDFTELQQRVRKAGYSAVPHMLSGLEVDGVPMHYLCTRKNIKKGTSGAKAVSWATEWALYFELSMRDKRVWNKWCDDAHHRHLQVAV